jgi:hypothetical protein
MEIGNDPSLETFSPRKGSQSRAEAPQCQKVGEGGAELKGLSMFKLDLKRVRENVAKATTDDLLERVTLYRTGMEPAALDVVETELRRRGVSYRAQEEFGAAQENDVLRGPDGSPLRCRRCLHAAVASEWGWHCLFGVLPVFPRRYLYCEQHRPHKPRKALPPPPAAQVQ